VANVAFYTVGLVELRRHQPCRPHRPVF